MSMPGATSDPPIAAEDAVPGAATRATRPCQREAVPRWVLLAIVIALGANVLAVAMTQVTIGSMRSLTPFAVMVRERDLQLIGYYQAFVFPVATFAVALYVWPIVRHFRSDPDQPASLLVQRRTVSAPLILAAVGLVAWLAGAVAFPIATVIQFGRWTTDLASQQVISPLVNGFLAATVIYLIIDALFRAMVVPRVFPDGRLAEVPGTLALGVRGRLVVFLLAVAFTPLFTVLGLIRAATAHVATGEAPTKVLADLTSASQITFAVYVILGIVFALLLARTLTAPLVTAAAALRRIQSGELATRVQPTASDEVGVLEDGVNAMAAALQEKDHILQTFGRIVEPAVRDHLLSTELHLGGQLRRATVLFSDLRGFTALSEQMAPAAVVATLNEYFSLMSDWVRNCGGFVDKFMGDAMLVVFGVFDLSEHGSARAAADAIRCGLGMHERLAELNMHRHAAGHWPLAISVGVDSGEVLAGTIGAEDRLEFTVIGDAVNVAARLQEVGKLRGAPLLVSEHTFDLACTSGITPPLIAFDTVPLRGRRESVRVYGVDAVPAAEARLARSL
jgi:adenylate cyclase